MLEHSAMRLATSLLTNLRCMRLTNKIVVFSSLCTTSSPHTSIHRNNSKPRIHTNEHQFSYCSGGLRPPILELLVKNSCLFVFIRGYPVFGILGNDGIDSSMTTHGNLSSSQIAFCGANGVGSSSDAIVTSIVSESLLPSKNKCVPQHAANERIRSACAILRGSPFVTTKSAWGTDPQVTYGAPALRRQSMQ